ncbi:MAG TPA: hypothetical protein PKD41_17495, partial [Solidesulfovibrio sp.]|nr:hypothetical protein [Solidesulfovibrio sp.]
RARGLARVSASPAVTAPPVAQPAAPSKKREAVTTGQKREAPPADGAERKKSRKHPRAEGQ